MELIPVVTLNGFPCFDFLDDYGKSCSIQLSSTVIPHLLLGLNRSNRMYLSIDQVKTLLPLLERFVRTGNIATDGKFAKGMDCQ